MLLFRFDGDNDASKREQNEACFSYAEREHLRSVISKSRCKGTASFWFPQEGTFWCHSYQKVGIVMLSGLAEFDFNFD